MLSSLQYYIFLEQILSNNLMFRALGRTLDVGVMRFTGIWISGDACDQWVYLRVLGVSFPQKSS